MTEVIKLLIGIIFLLLAWPVGDYLAKLTKEELSAGQKWFKLIILGCMLGAVISAILMNDILLFTFMFIMIVTSRSLIRKNTKKNITKKKVKKK